MVKVSMLLVFFFFLKDRKASLAVAQQGSSEAPKGTSCWSCSHSQGAPCPDQNSKGVEPSHPSGVLHSKCKDLNPVTHCAHTRQAYHACNARRPNQGV